MSNDRILVRYEIWQYNSDTDEYELRQNIKLEDVYKWQYTQCSGIEFNVLDVELKPRDVYTKFVPKSKADTNMIQPIILKKMRYKNNQPTSDYEALVFEFEEIFKENETRIHFVAYDVKKLEHLKLVTTNMDFSAIKEPEASETDTTERLDLPLSFAKYVKKANMKLILTELYDRALINPRTIEYGAIGVPDARRKVKGLGEIAITLNDDRVIDFAVEQIPLLEAKDILFSYLMYPLETTFDTNNGKINISVRAGRFIERSVIRKQMSIVEHAYVYKQDINYIAARGKANVVHCESDVKAIDFSSYEVQEDFSNLAGDKRDMLIAPTKAALKKQLQEAKEFLALNVVDPFSFIRAGDYFEFNLKEYTIKQLQETIQAGNADTFGFEIEERTIEER
jgi:hypothetical protein